MILILSDEDEPTTDLVIEWLHKLKKPFIRISCEQSIGLAIKKIYFTTTGIEAIFSYQNEYRDFEVDTKDITTYWYRRSTLRAKASNLAISDKKIAQIFAADISIEYADCIRILHYILNKKYKLNKEEDSDLYKLYLLEKAKECGLEIPDTLICSNKSELIPFYQKHNTKIITKSIADPYHLFLVGITNFTTQINLTDIPEQFGLSLFQEMIDKYVELRIFYFNNLFYGSAIFSQLDEQTKIDFKHYNTQKPNRVVPYKLPVEIERKLKKFMNAIGLRSGSLDIVLTNSGDYVFLEVNPVGQFEQVSMPCNYNIFKKIAETL